MPKTYNKPPLTHEEQLTHLKKRGLKIANHERALAILNDISYYRLSGYWHQFRQRDKAGNLLESFHPTTSFEEAVKLYEFDRKLRLLVLDALERIEVRLREQITYHLAHQYGAFGHMDQSNFHPQFKHSEWLQDAQKEAARSQEEFISHYKINYAGFPCLPVWMATEVMSFGALSKLFNGLKNEDKREIANIYHLHPKTLADWLHVLTYIRNICAHHSRLWNRNLAIRPNIHGLKDLQAKLPWLTNNKLPTVLLMIHLLLKANENGVDWRKNIEMLFSTTQHDELIRRSLGVPKYWQVEELWQSFRTL